MGQNARASLVAHLNKLCQVVLGIHVGGKCHPRETGTGRTLINSQLWLHFLGLQDNGLQAEAFGTCPVNPPLQVGIPMQAKIPNLRRHK